VRSLVVRPGGAGLNEGGSHEETGSDGVRLALGARGESIGRKEVTEGRIDAKILV
jgi:hypothetical protein